MQNESKEALHSNGKNYSAKCLGNLLQKISRTADRPFMLANTSTLNNNLMSQQSNHP